MAYDDSANVRHQAESLWVDWEQQQASLSAAMKQLAGTRLHAESRDGLVRVVANSAGDLVQVHIDSGAFRSSTPEKLGRSIAEAVQGAAHKAEQAMARAMAPLVGPAESMSDLTDLFPGAHHLRELRESFSAESTPAEDDTTRVAPPLAGTEDPDDDEDCGPSGSWFRPTH